MTWLIAATLLLWLGALLALWGVVRRRGVVARLRGLVTAAGLAALAVVGSSAVIVLHAFQAFSGETLVATVTTQYLSPGQFELTYAPAEAGAPTVVRLAGDQWAISAGIVKWHPWLTAVGLKSYHRPIRVAGQFARIERQRAGPPTVEPLGEGIDRLWEALYRLDPYLPFVEAVYGTCAYVYVEPGRTHELYVTPSGYLIKRASGRAL